MERRQGTSEIESESIQGEDKEQSEESEQQENNGLQLLSERHNHFTRRQRLCER